MSAGFRDKLYCKIWENWVRIALSHEDESFGCSIYLQVLNQNLQQEYKILLQIITNSARGDDTAYRMALYMDKKQTFLKIFGQIKQIETAIEEFESTLLSKSQMLLMPHLEEKSTIMIAHKEDIQNQISLKGNLSELHTQLSKTIYRISLLETLKTTKTLDHFLQALSDYLTLSQS